LRGAVARPDLGYNVAVVLRGALVVLAVACALTAVAAAPASDAVKRPALSWMRGDGSYTKASRTPRNHSITTIVIHATDGGSLTGNVWWLSGGHSHASAHYVIRSSGTTARSLSGSVR
jgi:N-acetyl-anhydromuramyl-L-alanine amidase AmpD